MNHAYLNGITMRVLVGEKCDRINAVWILKRTVPFLEADAYSSCFYKKYHRVCADITETLE